MGEAAKNKREYDTRIRAGQGKLRVGHEIPLEEFTKWMKALRSGKHKQGTGALQGYDEGYCCLGVACKVLIPKKKLIFSDTKKWKLDGGMPHSQYEAPAWLKHIHTDMEVKQKTERKENGVAVHPTFNMTTLNDSGPLEAFYKDGIKSPVTRIEYTTPATFNEIADTLEAIYLHGALDKVVA